MAPLHRRPQNNHVLQFPAETVVSFDPLAFDDFLGGEGVFFEHWACLPCPIGQIEVADGRRPEHDHSGCSAGYLYQLVGIVKGIFVSNGLQVDFMDVGARSDATALMTLKSHYELGADDTSLVQVFVARGDRLFLQDDAILVVGIDKQPVTAPVQRLAFPALLVERMVDSHGNDLRADADFVVQADGDLRWLRVPASDGPSGMPAIISVRYRYRPHWYIDRVPHEVRVAQVDDPQTGERTVRRFPHHIVLQREHAFRVKDRDGQSGDATDVAQAFPSTSLGPR